MDGSYLFIIHRLLLEAPFAMHSRPFFILCTHVSVVMHETQHRCYANANLQTTYLHVVWQHRGKEMLQKQEASRTSGVRI